ncbi:hypothetical protein WJ78_30305 [Burkholderia ubonensis]|nr:hypothetical protein WI89_18695 [Burkholderia ubonensis]KVO55204.1 hypothetical protein WJ78_30305 [Burkholderia ubonensis]KVP56436.1 hypothetical protein WJ90_02710 [Burkholderia ubonensis]KVR51204.1 hypothetical protein WK16_29555 [Burkholderia ubonensis]OJB08216.1 hypothetical protein BGV48_14925 [Burkholderia ubonensis]
MLGISFQSCDIDIRCWVHFDDQTLLVISVQQIILECMHELQIFQCIVVVQKFCMVLCAIVFQMHGQIGIVLWRYANEHGAKLCLRMRREDRFACQIERFRRSFDTMVPRIFERLKVRYSSIKHFVMDGDRNVLMQCHCTVTSQLPRAI